MSAGYLLDTNLLSATAPDRFGVVAPEKERARAWIRAHEDWLFLPVTAVAEVAAGIGALEAAGGVRRARDLAAWLGAVLAHYPDRVLAFDLEAALQARALQREARGRGVAPGFADLTVAAIARARGLVVATRNLRDFAPMAVAMVDPFEA